MRHLRERLDIGVGILNNRDGALIYSDGDMAIGGALDADRRATGPAAVLANHAAAIESARDMKIEAAQLNNTNGGVTWTMEPGQSTHVVEYSIPGSATRYDASQVFFGSGGYSPEIGWPSFEGTSAASPMSQGDNPNIDLIVPSPDYPLERYRAYYERSPAFSRDIVYKTSVGTGDNTIYEPRTARGAWYARTDPIWATFGVAPPAADLPETHPGRRDPDISVGQEGIPYLIQTESGSISEIAYFEHPVTQAEYDEWQAFRATHGQLDEATKKFAVAIIGNRYDANSRIHSIWDAYDLNVSTTTPVLQSSAPGQIIAGGKMDLTVASGTNEMSQILAGGALSVSGGAIVNVAKEVDATRQTHGSAIHSYVAQHSFADDERRYDVRGYDLVEPSTVTLAGARQEGKQGVAPGRPIEALSTGQASASAQGGAAVHTGTRVNPIVQVPSAVTAGDAAPGQSAQGGAQAGQSLDGASLVDAASGQNADANSRAGAAPGLVVRTSTPNTGLPSASLFDLNPGGRYLIETDPRFANHRNWLSSDYLLSNLGLDPGTTQKRLGDGFYEQRLIREQVAYLTGYRYLGGYASDEAQYTALMNAGAAFARQYSLRPGIALSAAQMAQLSSDIVWLVEQSVQLPGGSVQKVLVPQVYVRLKPGDIDGSGTLLSGSSVHMQLTGDMLNGGTIAGRNALGISAGNIHNLGGRISAGQEVLLKARSDLANIGATIDAGDKLSLSAGRDMHIESTTRLGAGNNPGVKIDSAYTERIAGLYVTNPGGQLDIQASRDITLKSAHVQSSGSAILEAGRDLKVQTLATGNQQSIHWNAKNSREDLKVQHLGSTIAAQGDLTLQAGNDLSAQAASLSAAKDATLRLSAGRDLSLQAGIDQVSSQTRHAYKSKSGINYETLNASGWQSTVAAAELSAGQIELQSGRDATLGAIEANADSLRIHTGGQLKLQTTSTLEQSARQATAGSSASVSASGKGATDETLRYNQLNARQLSIDAKGGIAAQAGQHVNLDQLARQPGLGWVDQIRNDPKLATSAQTQWQRVQEAHDQWEYRQSGMGPVSAALVAVMVGAVAAPAAASAGAAAGGAAGAATGSAMAGTAAGGAVQAGVLALSNQVGASFFNNGGDLGKVFKELGESESVKNLATAIVTGGVLSGMGFNPLGLPTPGSGALKFFTQLANNLQTQTASALIRTAINGGSLEDSLQDALKNALINSMAASVANGIGDLKEAGALNGFTNKIAHLMAGCAAGAAKSGGGDGCAPGAIGAAVGELAAEGIGRTDNTVYMAGLFGGLAAALAGGDNEAVAIANWAGSNAAANNYLSHSPFPEVKKRMAQENARLTAACEPNCTDSDFKRIDQQVDALDRAATLAEVAKREGLTTEQAQQLAQTLMELAPGYGTAESMLQLITGQSSLTGEEANRIWAAVGVVPVMGGMVRKVGEPAADALMAGFRALAGPAYKTTKEATQAANHLRELAIHKDDNRLDWVAEKMIAAQAAGWKTSTGAPIWPPSNGKVPGTEQRVELAAGQRLDRYGGTSDRSSFLAVASRTIASTLADTRCSWPGKSCAG